MSRRPTDTRERILDTATNLFSSHGFAATSIDDILKAVGITKGAFYHYFNSKEHLCQVILEQAIDSFHRLADSMLEGPDPALSLRQWLEVLAQKQRSGQWLYDRLLCRLTVEAAQLNPEAQNQLRMFWQWCQLFYEGLIRKAAGQRADLPAPSRTARLLAAALFGAVWLDRDAGPDEQPAAVCQALLELFLTAQTDLSKTPK